MASVLLVLTNPYAYDKALNLVIDKAKQADSGLKAVFVIDPDALDELVRELGESGWLGIGPRRSLQNSMLEGYRALATDVLEEVQRIGTEAGITVETKVEEVSLMSYLHGILNQETMTIYVSASQSLAPIMQELSEPIEWIQED